jgi:NADPH2:quinone reductase
MVTMADGASRAWRVHELGPPHQALRLEARPVRPPGEGEVRVRVEAVGLNFADLLVCAGRYQERPEPPFSPGFEAAGVVVQVGGGSTLRPGQRVIVVPEPPEGAMQESLTVGEEQVYPVPESVPVATAAVLHVAYATAHAALHRRAALRPGETLLITGGAGGVGSAAVQLGKAAGARVLATATGSARAEACRRLGADLVVDLAVDDDVVEQVRAATGGRGADVVVDVVGGDLFGRLRRCLAFEGRLVAVGFAGGSVPAVPVNHVLLRGYSVLGLYLSAYRRQDPALLRQIHDHLLSLLEEGRIDPAIHAELPFEQAPAGLQMVARREVIGRVVLRC